jgi:hypothetical protein
LGKFSRMAALPPESPTLPATTVSAPYNYSRLIYKSLALPDFKFHYDIFSDGSVKRILDIVVDGLLSHKYLHDWDEKLVSNPVKDLAIFAKAELGQNRVNSASYMVNFNIVQEVHTVDGTNHRRPAPRNPSDVASQLFPSKVPMVRFFFFCSQGDH